MRLVWNTNPSIYINSAHYTNGANTKNKNLTKETFLYLFILITQWGGYLKSVLGVSRIFFVSIDDCLVAQHANTELINKKIQKRKFDKKWKLDYGRKNTWTSRSAREKETGAALAIWVVNCAFEKGEGCGAAREFWKPKAEEVGCCWNSGVCCCCCCCCGWEEKGVEKREEPKAGAEEAPKAGVKDGVPNAGVEEGVAKEGVPKAGVEEGVPNAGVEEGVPKGDEEGWAEPNMVLLWKWV